jgi:hypothetical protein
VAYIKPVEVLKIPFIKHLEEDGQRKTGDSVS